MKRGILILVVILLIIITTFLTYSFLVTPVSAMVTDIMLSDISPSNETVDITLTVTALAELKGVSAQLSIPEGLEPISGETNWSGDLGKDETINITATLRAVEEGKWEITSSARTQTETKTGSFRIQTRTSPDENLYFHVNATEHGTTRAAISVPYEREDASDWILNKAKDYIVSYVGEKYFNEHIFVQRSWTEESGIGYRITYAYKFRIKGETNETIIDFSLWLDTDGNLVEYRGVTYGGPQKPYVFDINKTEAIRIAKEAGLPEATVKTMEKGGILYNLTKPVIASIKPGSNFGINESYIWLVESKNYQDNKPYAVYINMESGEVIRTLIFAEEKEIIPEEQKAWIEGLISQEDPEILERTFLFESGIVSGEPNQLKLYYGSAIPEDKVVIIIDLKNKSIISIEKSWWGD